MYGPLMNGIKSGGLGWVSHFASPEAFVEDSLHYGVRDEEEGFSSKYHGVGTQVG